MSPISVMIADGQRLFADALAMALERTPGIEVVPVIPTSGRDTLARVREHKPDVVLLDYWIEGMRGPATATAVGAPTCKVLMLSWMCGRTHIEEAFEAGAAGFLLKSVTLEQVAGAIESVRIGRPFVLSPGLEEVLAGTQLGLLSPRHPSDRVADVRNKLATLSARELAILERLSLTGSREDVAKALSISPRTVRSHIYKILEKTGARNQAEVVALGERYGLLSPSCLEATAPPHVSQAPAAEAGPVETIRVLVGDAQPLFAAALGQAISLYPGITALDERPNTADEAIEVMAQQKPDVALLDYWMPGVRPDGVYRVLHAAAGCKVMMLSWNHASTHIRQALEAGIPGFLPKSLGVGQVVEAIRLASGGEPVVYGEGTSKLMAALERRCRESISINERVSQLTPRERDILSMLSFGDGTLEVADRLSIDPKTVRAHIRHILVKTKTRSRAQAVAMARRAGVV